jgi:transposase-like protein
MSPRKLTDTDKTNILNLYRNPEETTSTLAARYGVSNSTISRILKSNLVESEYEVLIQQKRANRTPGGASSPMNEDADLPVESEAELSAVIQTPELPIAELPIESEPKSSVRQTAKPKLVLDKEKSSSVSESTDQRRRRKRSSVMSQLDTEQEAIQTELPLGITTSAQTEPSFNEFDEIEQEEARGFEELLDEEDLMDLDDEDDEDDEDDDLEDDLEDDWEDDLTEAEERELPIKTSRIDSGAKVQVLPLSEASLPRTCYLVVDRGAELIARPLKEFSDLGRIPIEEVQEKTLPVFDNHKVARRFSNRSQRVIKVPDGRMLQKTRSYLQAKGITRLLIDGQVYSLFPT